MYGLWILSGFGGYFEGPKIARYVMRLPLFLPRKSWKVESWLTTCFLRVAICTNDKSTCPFWDVVYIVLQARIPSRTADHASSKACDVAWFGKMDTASTEDWSQECCKSTFGQEKRLKGNVFSNWVYVARQNPLVRACWHGKGKMWLIHACISNYTTNQITSTKLLGWRYQWPPVSVATPRVQENSVHPSPCEALMAQKKLPSSTSCQNVAISYEKIKPISTFHRLSNTPLQKKQEPPKEKSLKWITQNCRPGLIRLCRFHSYHSSHTLRELGGGHGYCVIFRHVGGEFVSSKNARRRFDHLFAEGIQLQLRSL